jgi:hypothetical protein
MSILSIDLHSSTSTIRLSFHFQNVTYESLDDINCSKFSIGCNPHVLGWRPQPCVTSLQLDVGCPVVIAAAIPDAMMVPTDECFAQEIPEPVYDGLTCLKYALWDSNPGSWLVKEQKSRLRFGGRRFLLLNDEAWRCHPYYIGLVASGWLSKWGTTTCFKTSLMYWSPIRLPCMVTKSSLQSWEITPSNHYWASTVRNSWLDVPWGIGCIFASPNPHPAVGYMKQKLALFWPMDLAPCP